MKEYIAGTGGRYTYADDILNLQELSLSMTAIFEGCPNFIISGCGISGSEISPGHVWINGKVRRFEGCADAKFPYYIYEKNSNDTVVYANDVNKRGRCNYLCEGGVAVPGIPDAVTGNAPSFIELTPGYSPRFVDKFFGRYAVLLETPFARQTVKKELVLAGKFSGEKEIESKTAVSVANVSNGYVLKSIVKASGDASVGVYLNGLLINEIVILTNGTFSFLRQGRETARIGEEGIICRHSISTASQSGSIRIFGSHVVNTGDATDEGAVHINHTGYKQGGTKFRDFHVYNGKTASVPIFRVTGKTETVQVNGVFSVRNQGKGITLASSTYLKTDRRLVNSFAWADSAGEAIAHIGFAAEDSFDFSIKNALGNITVVPKGYLDIVGELKIRGISIADIYVSRTDFDAGLKKKVNAVTGKQLSTEDFTTEYKNKLESISGSSIGSLGNGFVTAKDVGEALAKKLSAAANLSDVPDRAAARINMGVYSKTESNGMFLKIQGNLLELVTLTADEVNGMTTEQIAARKAEKQAIVRDNIDAEKKGTGDLKLARASNLADLADKDRARKNIGVYSTEEIDRLLKGKLSVDAAYTGAVFTAGHKTKLEAIKTGAFAGTDNEGKSTVQVEGYAMIGHVARELAKKANLLLDGYNGTQKETIAANLGVYTKVGADAKFASVENLMQDYITHLVKQGKSTTEAKRILRDRLNAPDKDDVANSYLRKDGKLTDLLLPDMDAKKLACRVIGAAYADEYQSKLTDTGWIQMANSGSGTDTRGLFIRQIGNVVCIQGTVNTARRDGSNRGGTVAIIPNQISPPKYGLRTSLADFNDGHKYNRGASFVIQGNTRKILIYESGWYNVITEIHFTYMT